MTEPTTSAPPERASRIPRGYMAFWGICALCALAYLAFAFARPDLLSGYLATGPSEHQSGEVQPTLADLAAELGTQREALTEVRGALDALRAQVLSQGEMDKSLEGRIAAVEVNMQDAATAQRTSALPEPAPRAEPARPAAPARKLAETKDAPRPAPKAKAPAAKAAAKAPPRDGPPVTLETGSVERPEAGVTFGPPIVTEADEPAAIQIATGPNVDALRVSWSLLQSRHGALSSLEPRYKTGTTPQGTKYDLVAGPIASPAEARRICDELGAKGTPCRVSNFGGNGLGF